MNKWDISYKNELKKEKKNKKKHYKIYLKLSKYF